MPLYESLAPYYDAIFPVNKTACSFLLSQFEYADTVLDVGAGTGNMAVELVQSGLQAIAAEPDAAMADFIKQKAVEKSVAIQVHVKGMQEIEQITERIDGIYCIGNTLPHVDNAAELENFIKKCYEMLSSGGKLILQLVNYEKVLVSVADFAFPVINKDSLTFTRSYKQSGDKILFTTNLTVDGKLFQNSIPLYPVTSAQLLPILQEAGFEVENTFGNFACQDYTKDSPALIVVAKK